jgi:transcriptional regulator with XRE-family HTH domain
MKAEWFAGRLRELREAAGLTQQQLAERAGMAWRTVTHLEGGDRKPTWETVVALCVALGVGSDEFLKPPAAPTGPRPRGRPRKATTSAVDAVADEEGPGAAPTDQRAPRARDATQTGKGDGEAAPRTLRRKKRE